MREEAAFFAKKIKICGLSLTMQFIKLIHLVLLPLNLLNFPKNFYNNDFEKIIFIYLY